MHLPFEVADYVDFFSSEHHAQRRPHLSPRRRPAPAELEAPADGVPRAGGHGCRFGDPDRAALRPAQGGRRRGADVRPLREARHRGGGGLRGGGAVPAGSRVPVGRLPRSRLRRSTAKRLVGACDIQGWESVPLGPFLGKSFVTSVSPWVVTLDALEAARVTSPPQDPVPMKLPRGGRTPWPRSLIEVEWNGTVVSRPPFADMYWSPAQQLAHMTVNGASLRTGPDLDASGTVSGSQLEQRGLFSSRSWNGSEPVVLDSGDRRSFLEDGDVVTIRATAQGTGETKLGFGEVTGGSSRRGETSHEALTPCLVKGGIVPAWPAERVRPGRRPRRSGRGRERGHGRRSRRSRAGGR